MFVTQNSHGVPPVGEDIFRRSTWEQLQAPCLLRRVNREDGEQGWQSTVLPPLNSFALTRDAPPLLGGPYLPFKKSSGFFWSTDTPTFSSVQPSHPLGRVLPSGRVHRVNR